MNKSELVDFIAGEAEISKAAAGRALDAVTTAVKENFEKRWHCHFGWFWYIFSGQTCGAHWS
jgi:nucleoid DNA-binding protein